MLMVWYGIVCRSAVLAVSLILLVGVRTTQAAEITLVQPIGEESFDEVTPVSELLTVQPTDLSFQALQSLRVRYGVVAGDANDAFQGNRALTRDEFAASLNAAIAQINQLIQTGASNRINRLDLEALQRLQAEFAGELGATQQQIESVETRSSAVSQFSTTTQLSGEVLLILGGVSPGNRANDDDDRIDSNLTFSNRVRLNFDTSFTGRDRLRTRLQTGNIPRLDRATGTDMARAAFQTSGENQFELSRLEYRFPIGKRLMVYLEAVGGGINDYVNALNPFLSSSSRGSLSRFGQRNPIYRQGDGTGLGLEYEFNDDISLSLGYIAANVNEPDVGFGNAAYATITQLTIKPSKNFELGFTYIHSYNSLDTGTGSDRANDPFDNESNAITADSFGIQATAEITDGIVLAGWVGYTYARSVDLPKNPTASILNWAVTLAFPDLGEKGNVAGILIGQPPKAIGNDFEIDGQAYKDEATSLHLEAFYRYRINDFIAITPGVFVITNPNHDSDNNTIYVGIIRTTFSF